MNQKTSPARESLKQPRVMSLPRQYSPLTKQQRLLAYGALLLVSILLIIQP